MYLFIAMGLFDFCINELIIIIIYVYVSNMKVEIFVENDPVNCFKIVTSYFSIPIYLSHSFASWQKL